MDGGASVIRALVRNSGTCRPAVAGSQWRQDGPAAVRASENPKQLICEGESSDAGHRGGQSRSARRAAVFLAGGSPARPTPSGV